MAGDRIADAGSRDLGGRGLLRQDGFTAVCVGNGLKDDFTVGFTIVPAAGFRWFYSRALDCGEREPWKGDFSRRARIRSGIQLTA